MDWLSVAEKEEGKEEEGEEGESIQKSPRDAFCRKNSGFLFLPFSSIRYYYSFQKILFSLPIEY